MHGSLLPATDAMVQVRRVGDVECFGLSFGTRGTFAKSCGGFLVNGREIDLAYLDVVIPGRVPSLLCSCCCRHSRIPQISRIQRLASSKTRNDHSPDFSRIFPGKGLQPTRTGYTTGRRDTRTTSRKARRRYVVVGENAVGSIEPKYPGKVSTTEVCFCCSCWREIRLTCKIDLWFVYRFRCGWVARRVPLPADVSVSATPHPQYMLMKRVAAIHVSHAGRLVTCCCSCRSTTTPTLVSVCTTTLTPIRSFHRRHLLSLAGKRVCSADRGQQAHGNAGTDTGAHLPEGHMPVRLPA